MSGPLQVAAPGDTQAEYSTVSTNALCNGCPCCRGTYTAGKRNCSCRGWNCKYCCELIVKVLLYQDSSCKCHYKTIYVDDCEYRENCCIASPA